MATAHHLSVIANSLVKPPINPDTGLSVTQHERSAIGTYHSLDEYPQECDRNHQDWQTDDVNMMNGGGGVGGRIHESNGGVFGRTDSMIQDLTSDLGNLSDEQFYKRLLELKNEHKKTLSFCETLYSQKVDGHNNAEHVSGINHRENHVHNYENCASHRHRESLNNSYNAVTRSTSSSIRDNVKDMSKPPSGRSCTRTAKPSVMRSQEFQLGHVQADHYDSDEDYWKPVSAITTDVELSRDEGHDSMCQHHHHHEHNDSRHSAMSHIDDMWDHFSVEDYAPLRGLQRSSSLSRMSRSSSKKSNKNEVAGSVDTENWRHRVTLPKPFNMSLRESTKSKEKSQTLLEYEQRRDDRIKADEEECQKKFKAKPVPAHVYMPLFDEKMEEMETRRKFHRENSKELLKSMEKPFNFMKREEERKKYRNTSRKDVTNTEIQQKPPTDFKARPFPAHIFDDTVMDRLQEEEEYRKIRVQMRAEELLKSSSLPPNMAAKGKDYTDGKSRQKIYAERAKQAGITSEHKFQPKINDSLPDFEERHRQMQMDLSHKKRAKEATVCKPFNLRTERIASSRHKVYEDIARDADELKSKTWCFNKSPSSKLFRMRSMSSSMDSIPTKTTTSSQLRTIANRTKIQQELDAQLAELESERQQRLKEKKIKKYISERVALNDNSKDLEQSLKTKLKQYKVSEKERKLEYLQMLNEIEERIEKRPLLFERALQANAKRTAEKKYQDTLRQAGLDSDYITAQGMDATKADMDAVSDDEAYMVSRVSSAKSSARSVYRARTPSHSDIRSYSDDYDEENRTSEGSDMECG